DEACVQRPSPVLQQPSIRDLVGQRVFEGALELREEMGLVEEVRCLKAGEPVTKLLVFYVSNRFQERERDVFADHRGSLEQPFVFWLEAVDAGRQDRLRRRRDLQTLWRCR